MNCKEKVLTVKDFISLLQECDQNKALSVYDIGTGERYYLNMYDIDFDVEDHVEININK
jgi:hypothetical protein